MRKFVPVVLAALILPAALSPTIQAQSPATVPTWTCSLDDIGATLTKCVISPAVPEASQGLFITDIVATSTTSTAGLFLVRYGTGSNCGTGTVSILPSAATVPRIPYQANTGLPTVLQFATPVKVPRGVDLCIIGSATNTFSGQISGYFYFN